MNYIIKRNFFSGWSVYSITYKDKQYVVTVSPTMNDLSTTCFCNIYEYNEEKRNFKGHRGKWLFECEIFELNIIDKGVLAMYMLNEMNLKLFLPIIMHAIFTKYEEHIQKKINIEKQFQESENWDAVVKL